MPSAEFFNKFGLFSERNFLDREFCYELCKKMSVAPQKQGKLVDLNTAEDFLDEKFTKRSQVTELPKLFLDEITNSLIALIPKLEEHFNTELKGIQRLAPSIYRKGDFFAPHNDKPANPNSPQYIKDRKVSVIVFLNEESPVERKGTYCGGNLTFYGLVENQAFENLGLPLIGEPGMLIAFSPETIHQVTEVTAGERFVIVSFYE